MTNYIQIATTLPSQEAARKLGRVLVEQRLAACVQVSGPLESTYWWQDEIETATEWRLLAKSRVDLFPAIEASIRRHHPYDTPEILATSILAGHPDYLEWMHHELTPDA